MIEYVKRPRLVVPHTAGLYRHAPTKSLVHVEVSSGWKGWYCQIEDCERYQPRIIRLLWEKDHGEAYLDAREAAWCSSSFQLCPHHWAAEPPLVSKAGEWEQIIRRNANNLDRDFQQKKVYDAEAYYLTQCPAGSLEDKAMSFDDSVAYLERIAEQVGRGAPGLTFNDRLNGGYATAYNIHVESEAATPCLLRHEFAHLIYPNRMQPEKRREGGHGPSFAWQTIQLAVAALGPMAGYELQDCYDKYGVQYSHPDEEGEDAWWP